MATCLTGMPASNLCAKMGATLPSGCLGVFYHQCRSFLILEGWLQAQWVSPGRPEPSGVRKCNSRGLALDFLDSSYLGFRALLNLNPWTRQSSCKNIVLLHLVAWEGREGSVGLFGLAYYRVSQVCVFPLHFPKFNEKDIFQIPFLGESASLKGSGRPEMRILWKDCEILIFILSSLFVNTYLNAVYLYRNLSKKMYRVCCPIGIQPYKCVFNLWHSVLI